MAEVSRIEGTDASPSPLDQCCCGDFRRAHQGDGRCWLCGCGGFRLWRTESDYARLHPKHHAELTRRT